LKEIRTEITIDAPADRVWNILTDFPRYGAWNPFIYEAKGHANVGAKIRIKIRTPGGKEREYEPLITSADGHELRWTGKSFFLTGDHFFALKEIDARSTLLIQREVFRGPLSLFFGENVDEDIAAGFEQMNRALKHQAELKPPAI
jgi:hypothetical protein